VEREIGDRRVGNDPKRVGDDVNRQGERREDEERLALFRRMRRIHAETRCRGLFAFAAVLRWTAGPRAARSNAARSSGRASIGSCW